MMSLVNLMLKKVEYLLDPIFLTAHLSNFVVVAVAAFVREPWALIELKFYPELDFVAEM